MGGLDMSCSAHSVHPFKRKARGVLRDGTRRGDRADLDRPRRRAGHQGRWSRPELEGNGGEFQVSIRRSSGNPKGYPSRFAGGLGRRGRVPADRRSVASQTKSPATSGDSITPEAIPGAGRVAGKEKSKGLRSRGGAFGGKPLKPSEPGEPVDRHML